MKFFIACVALAAVAVASPLHKPNEIFEAELSAIVAAINHPSTDSATAVLLQEQLDNIMSQLNYEPISVDPVIIDQVAPVEVVESPVVPAPVVVAPAPSGKPLVQVIINVNGASAEVTGVPVVPSPVLTEIAPTPVIVVEQPIAVEPVIVVDQPIAAEPVIVSPILFPEPVVLLPDILN